MNKRSFSILILGGGVAGMAAARFLDHQDLSVHLVEEKDHLGGNASLWACMATDTCQNCGACLTHEMAEQVTAQKNITLHLNTKINTLNRTDQGIQVLLTSGKTIAASKVIMATGFSPFDPARLPSLHWETGKNIITTVQLNALIRQEGLADLLGKIQNPRIAFIQCVGSRNRELKKEYCSQVCCKISLRHAQKLGHEIPDANITLFYMDLQLVGKEIRKTAETLSQQVTLVQGVPAEILENPDTGTLTLVTEDGLSRIKKEFDLVVLSVGMESPPDLKDTATLLEALPNEWGFFNTQDALVSKDLYIAGCAAGPKDILSSKQEGRIAGAKVIQDLDLARKPDMNVAILGKGPQAALVAKSITAKGFSVYAFGIDPGTAFSPDALPHAKILAVDGTLGNFSIYFEDHGKKQTLTFGAIIAAEEAAVISNTGPGRFQTAMDLNAFEQLAPGDCPQKILILLDYFGPEFKTTARRALLAAMAAGKQGKEVTIVLNKMLVHGALGQVLYDRARSQGIRFLRFDDAGDIKITTRKKGFLVHLKEATLPGMELELACDCLVVPESIRANKDFQALASFLGTPLDREGFLQSANVRHRLIQSPRRGIFFAGTCHDEVDGEDLETEIQEILSALTHPKPLPPKETGVMVNEKKCAKCLTCYRICPHGAIFLNEKMRPQIMEDACFSCHLCVANCPAYAIESTNFTNDQIGNRVTDWGKKGQIVVFACERSAALAAEKAGLPKTCQVISLPCACRISCDMILKSLINGAAKIIVSPCHEGNCRSMDGSTTARAALNAIAKMPGITPDKVAWEPVAANETIKFERIISKAKKDKP